MPGFLADECVAAEIVQLLRDLGLDVAYVKEICPGSPDPRVLRLASDSGRVLITNDPGFGELAVRRDHSANGVVIVSLYALPKGMRERYAADRIHELGEGAVGCLVVMEPGRVHRRPLSERET